MTDDLNDSMHHAAPHAMRHPDCLRCEAQLSPFLEGELTGAERAAVLRHASGCAECGALLRDVDDIIVQSGALAPLAPTRDLWAGIEQRLEAPVTAITARSPVAAEPRRFTRTVTVRQFAAAAALLVAVSSAVTWRLVRPATEHGVAPMELAAGSHPVVPSMNALTAGDSVTSADPVATVRFSRASDVNAVYQEQINALRQLVDARFADLDSMTVAELRRNLTIIDQAIADSRRALERSPNSGMLASQLDRVLQSKLALMRRVVLL